MREVLSSTRGLIPATCTRSEYRPPTQDQSTGHLHKIRGRARYSASQNGRFHEHHRTQPASSYLRPSSQLKFDILNFRAD
jgi:hypothetical protein